MTQRNPLLYFSLAWCLFTLFISVKRFSELWKLPSDAEVAPGYPNWLLSYLWAIVISLGVASLLGVYYSSLVMAKVLSGKTLLVPCIAFAIWIAGRTYYLFGDPDVGNGGMVRGVYDVMTLTRNVSSATDAGEMGYRVGQAIGLIGQSMLPLLLFACSIPNPTSKENADEASDRVRGRLSPDPSHTIDHAGPPTAVEHEY